MAQDGQSSGASAQPDYMELIELKSLLKLYLAGDIGAREALEDPGPINVDSGPLLQAAVSAYVNYAGMSPEMTASELHRHLVESLTGGGDYVRTAVHAAVVWVTADDKSSNSDLYAHNRLIQAQNERTGGPEWILDGDRPSPDLIRAAQVVFNIENYPGLDGRPIQVTGAVDPDTRYAGALLGEVRAREIEMLVDDILDPLSPAPRLLGPQDVIDSVPRPGTAEIPAAPDTAPSPGR